MSVNDSEIPQWKKDLIARLRNQNKRTANVVIERQQQQLYPPQNTTSMVVESSSSSSSSPSVQQVNRCESVVVSSSKHKSDVISCNFNNNNSKNKMVQESLLCNWDDHHQYYKNGDDYHYNDDSEKNSLIDDNFDDLHYGPGIVNKLKNKYLSLILRESNNITTISPMRKAASLENILDDCGGDNNDYDDDKQLQQQQQSNNTNNLYNKKLDNNEINKNQPNRYRKMTRGNDKIIVKRARSVETISRHNNIEIIKHNQQQINEQQKRNKRESMPEEMLINFNNNREGNGMDNKQSSSSSSSSYPSNPPRINRPKRLQPVVNEKEKPPVDFVKQTKLIFERHRPELYKKKSILTTTVATTTSTPTTNGGGGGSEVAAKVQTYKNIIVKNKPPIKQKPTMIKLKTTRNNDDGITIKTPPDISQLEITKNGLSSDTPDLIITSSPVSPISTNHLKTTATFIKEEIRNNFNNDNDSIALKLSPIRHDKNVEEKEQIEDKEKTTQEDGENDDNTSNSYSFKQIPPQTMLNIDKASTTITYNFATSNRNILNDQTPINQPLKLDTTTISAPTSPKIIEKINKLVSPPLKSSSSSIKPALTMLEIEKNLINTVKTLEQPKNIVNNNNNNNSSNSSSNNNSENVLQKVPKLVKKSPPKRELENNSNSIVFKFTDRKDVPDYLHDDGSIRVAKIERPKVGEGGIILLPGASIEESFTEDDDDEVEIMRSLEAPPSPCDVTFINDNILIDGKSSLITTQKATKRNNSKLKISFVEEGPEIYEYPSESSFVIDDTVVKQQQSPPPPPPPPQQMGGHTVPSLSGSSLANYTPKGTEEFQPGVTRTSIKLEEKSNDCGNSNETILQETVQPITFSAGTNSDILF